MDIKLLDLYNSTTNLGGSDFTLKVKQLALDYNIVSVTSKKFGFESQIYQSRNPFGEYYTFHYNRDVQNRWKVFLHYFFETSIGVHGIRTVFNNLVMKSKYHRNLLAADMLTESIVYWYLKNLFEDFEKEEAKKQKRAKRREFLANTKWQEPGKVSIPDIGYLIKLSEDWTFNLYYEGRNDSLLKAIGCEDCRTKGRVNGVWVRIDKESETVTLKAGSVLSVDRIYIRKGGEDYSSLTFWLKGTALYNGEEFNIGKLNDDATTFLKGKVRFWAKLDQVNKIVGQMSIKE